MNKTTGNYFKNMFLRKKKLLMLYTFICFMAYPFILIVTRMTEHYARYSYNVYMVSQLMFGGACFVLGALALVLPIFSFKFSFTKRNVDTFFSLPINRRHLFKSHFFAPMIGAMVPLLLNYLIGAAVMVGMCSVPLHTVFELLLLLLMAFVFFMIIYSVNTFFVLHCNNLLDACVIGGSLIFLPILVYTALYVFLNSQIVSTGMVSIEYDLPEIVLNLLNPYTTLVRLQSLINISFTPELYLDFSDYPFIYLIYYLIIGVLAYVGASRQFKKKKGEDAEQLTTSFITYPLFINVGMISFIILFNFVRAELIEAILWILVLFVIFVIVNGIAKRSMHLQKSMVLSFVVILTVVSGFNYISKETEFFGINRRVIDYTDYAHVDWQLSRFDEIDSDELDVDLSVKEMSETEKEMMQYLEELQKAASLNFKEGNYIDSQYHLSIVYHKYDDKESAEKQHVWFDLTKEQGEYVKKMMEKVLEEE